MILSKEVKHLWPVSWFFKPIQIHNKSQARKVFSWVRAGVNQFAILNPVLCFTQVFVYKLTMFDSTLQNVIYNVCETIIWISCWIALYFLGMLLMTFLTTLSHYKPILKFLTIKIVL